MLFQYRPAWALPQPFPEQQLQATITDKHFTEHRAKAAVHSRQLLSPDRNFPSDLQEVLRSLFRVIGGLCRTRSLPAGWMMLQSFQVHGSNIWSHFSTSLSGFWWREIFCPLRRGKALVLSYDIYLLWKFITFFHSYQFCFSLPLMLLSLIVTILAVHFSYLCCYSFF